MVNDERDPESGEYTGKYPDDVFVAAVREHAADNPLGFARTADVTETVGCDNATAHRRLHTLAEHGVLERLYISPAVAWRIAGQTDETADAADTDAEGEDGSGTKDADPDTNSEAVEDGRGDGSINHETMYEPDGSGGSFREDRRDGGGA